MKRRSITFSWFTNIFSIILVLLAVSATVGSISVYNYIRGTVSQRLKTTAMVTAQYFNRYSGLQTAEFYSAAVRLASDFSEKEKIELQIIDSNGSVLSSTSGFLPSAPVTSPDVERAYWNQTADYYGKSPETGERIYAVSSGLKDTSGSIRAVARFVISTREMDKLSIIIISAIIGVCLVVLTFVYISGTFYVRGLVKPVALVNQAAKAISDGNLDVRIEESFEHEVGDLVDSINQMADSLSQTENLKNDFISSVSHELRTPLTSIKGWSETMLSCNPVTDADTINHGLKIIDDEAGRLSKMVEELLDFSKMQSGRMTLSLERTDIGQVLIETIYMMAERARREGIIIEYLSEGGLPAVMADKDRLKQVFINVIDNAVKHSESEDNIIVRSEIADGCVSVSVSDNGKGIPEAYLAVVKEKFIKGPSSKRGSGLGLALADEIMLQHNGTLTLRSAENQGTTVIITIPVAQDDIVQ